MRFPVAISARYAPPRMRRHRSAGVAAWIGMAVLRLTLCGCAAANAKPVAQRPPTNPQPEVVAREPVLACDYRFTLDAALRSLTATICFHAAPPPDLITGYPEAASMLGDAWVVAPEGRRLPLPVAHGRIDLHGLADRACIGYGLDLADQSSRLALVRREGALVANTALFLLRPARGVARADVTARFDVEGGIEVSVPWSREGDHYRLEPSAFAFYAYAAFGGFERERMLVAGATFDIAVLPGLAPEARASIAPWLEHAAELVSNPFGRFPRDRAQIIVLPADALDRHGYAAQDDPVPFATVTRGGGVSALMLVAPHAKLAALEHDWVAVHEFSHLLLPFLRRQDAWLSEGIATYYQEVLRVRGGMEHETQAWRRLHAFAAISGELADSVAQESVHMHERHSYKAVYWAGAAFALICDAQLRRATAGRVSLESALEGLSKQNVTQSRPLSAREVLSLLDRSAGVQLCEAAMQTLVVDRPFPGLSSLYDELGVRIEANDEIHFDDHAHDAWIRAAIMHGPR